MNTKVRRLAERAHYDRATVDAILDAAYVAHVGVVHDGYPVVLPFACARVGDDLLLHGSTKAGVLGAVAEGAPMCATVTLLDGLVVARSAFHSSMNYRCAVVQGTARLITGAAEKARALDAYVEKMFPGYGASLRDHTPGELEATSVIALAIDHVSAKIRTGGPKDAPEDVTPDQWAGVVPMELVLGTPQPDPSCAPGLRPPAFAAR